MLLLFFFFFDVIDFVECNSPADISCIYVPDAHKESWVGRQIDDSSELKDKSITSHVARMTGGGLTIKIRDVTFPSFKRCPTFW